MSEVAGANTGDAVLKARIAIHISDAHVGHNVESAADNSTAGRIRRREPLPNSGSRLIGSYASVARMLDEMSEIDGLAGVMLTFDDFVIGVEQFGQRIQPLMRSRRNLAAAA